MKQLAVELKGSRAVNTHAAEGMAFVPKTRGEAELAGGGLGRWRAPQPCAPVLVLCRAAREEPVTGRWKPLHVCQAVSCWDTVGTFLTNFPPFLEVFGNLKRDSPLVFPGITSAFRPELCHLGIFSEMRFRSWQLS